MSVPATSSFSSSPAVGSSPRAFAPDHHVGNQYANKVERNHRHHENEHRLRVGSGREDGSRHRNNQHRVAEIFEQELRSHDSEYGEDKNQHGQFKYNAQPQEDHLDVAEILVNINEGLDGAAVRKADEEVEYLRKHNEIAIRNSADKLKHRRNDEPRGGAAFVLVEARRDESPDLIQHPGHRQSDAHVDSQINPQADVARGMRIVEMRVQMVGKQRLQHWLH